MFDESVGAAQTMITSAPAYEPAIVISSLDQLFVGFGGAGFDRELSWTIVTALTPLYDVGPGAIVEDRVRPFIEQNAAKLADLLRNYRDDSRANPLLTQPEVLMVFERLAADPYTLREAWPAEVPTALLENLAEVWGRPY